MSFLRPPQLSSSCPFSNHHIFYRPFPSISSSSLLSFFLSLSLGKDDLPPFSSLVVVRDLGDHSSVSGSLSGRIRESGEIGVRIETVRHHARALIVKASLTDAVRTAARRDIEVLRALANGGDGSKLSKHIILTLLQDVFVAGSDTSSSTIEWAMAELLRNPKKMVKAKAELRDKIREGKQIEELDITSLRFTCKQVVKETLRLHPLSRFASHELKRCRTMWIQCA
ncbi:hypothetical protein Scep_027364 [Stephania cephalantha]|uniref:Cytochrome P450 n=1 Tax=Stephania cephalantha TaxID=152367 RepID=A0AAP0EB89_9MAGN